VLYKNLYSIIHPSQNISAEDMYKAYLINALSIGIIFISSGLIVSMIILQPQYLYKIIFVTIILSLISIYCMLLVKRGIIVAAAYIQIIGVLIILFYISYFGAGIKSVTFLL
jgi:hypothetical protein